MFSLFKKASAFKSTDKVWKTNDHALRGLATDALKAITLEEIPVVLSFFDESKNRVMSYFAAKGAPCFDLKSETLANTTHLQKVIFCANAFECASLLTNSSLYKKKIRFLFESHYPLTAPEQHVLEELHTLTGASSFTFYLSIDGPLMKVFNSGNLIPLMEKLGLKDDECIEHNMVSRSVLRAREKINETTPHEIRAASEKEWYDRNITKSR